MTNNSTDSETRPRTPPTPDYGLPSLIHHGITAALVAAFLGLGIWFILKDNPAVPTGQAPAETLAEAREVRTEHRVRRALQVHPLRFGSEADTLESLLRKGLLVPRDLYYGSRELKFRLSSGDDGPILERTDRDSTQP